MTYKTILVQAEPADRAAARIACAGDLADRFDALLLGLGAGCADPRRGVSAEQVQSDIRLCQAAFERLAGNRRQAWITREAAPAVAIAEASRAADLIVMGGGGHPGEGAAAAEIIKVILTSGRPVLVAPPAGDYCSAKQVLVAWRDTREARRAVSDALPFLLGAKDVLVLEVCDRADLAPARTRTADVAASLRRHGVEARSDALASAAGGALETLSDCADRLGADLIIAGAYGHSRAGEQLFGGVTLSLLQQTRRHVLFSH